MTKKAKFDEAQFLSILEKVLPQATRDPKLAHAIYDSVAKEIQIFSKLVEFERFCQKDGLPDLAPETVGGLEHELVATFGENNVALTTDEEKGTVAVEITLPDRMVSTEVRIQTEDEAAGSTAPFVPFPVSMPADPELIWMLARREDFGPDEAVRSLGSIEEEFWGTKVGQKLLKQGCERGFVDFIQHVPSAMLAESGLKRHYKAPETRKSLKLLPATAAAA